ncbi:unnamed protein product [Rangifer tarandus platyrhynchus]|uniref:Uncharacterized protein n=2 Tax=Rangifer tarandus platyrhynchus TaxID=3082113 RepID=A0ACB0DPM6_RANTA|nr:unnamed protein product [Rangifer tarandus platyrhynchus]CAI9690216.1 unnamed protein product [Rangifer tarandus platyrhynchus]
MAQGDAPGTGGAYTYLVGFTEGRSGPGRFQKEAALKLDLGGTESGGHSWAQGSSGLGNAEEDPVAMLPACPPAASGSCCPPGPPASYPGRTGTHSLQGPLQPDSGSQALLPSGDLRLGRLSVWGEPNVICTPATLKQEALWSVGKMPADRVAAGRFTEKRHTTSSGSGGRGRHLLPQAAAAFPFTVAVVLAFTRLLRGTPMAQGEPRGTIGHPSGAWGKAGSVPPSWGFWRLARGMPEANAFPEDLRLSPVRAPGCRPQISFPCKHPAPQNCVGLYGLRRGDTVGFGAGSPTGPGGARTAALAPAWSCPVWALFDRGGSGRGRGGSGFEMQEQEQLQGMGQG